MIDIYDYLYGPIAARRDEDEKPPPFSSRKFFYWWMIGSLAFVPLLLLLLFMPGATLAGWSLHFRDVSGGVRPQYLMFAGAVVGIIAGFGLGFIQEWVMYRWFYLHLQNWIWLTILGGALGGMVALPVVHHLGAVILALVIFMAVVSAVQWLTLRQYVNQAWLWGLANVAGTASFAMTLPHWGIGATLHGLITGLMMLWLFQLRAYAWVFDTAARH